MSEINIRIAASDDAELLYNMLYDKADREGLAQQFTTTVSDLSNMIARKVSVILIAEYNGAPAGMANYHLEDSTFTGKTLVTLDDLYTSPDFGGRGVAKALLRYVGREALEYGYRIKIAPLISNERPREWYQRLGAQPIYDACVMRIDDVDAFLDSL